MNYKNDVVIAMSVSAIQNLIKASSWVKKIKVMYSEYWVVMEVS